MDEQLRKQLLDATQQMVNAQLTLWNTRLEFLSRAGRSDDFYNLMLRPEVGFLDNCNCGCGGGTGTAGW